MEKFEPDPLGIGNKETYEVKIEILFPTRASANKALNSILDVVDKYGFATVADLHDICGLQSKYKDSLWGWTDGSDIGFVENGVNNTFVIAPAPPILLKQKQVNHGPMTYGQGVMEITDAGALRESNEGRGRFDLLPYEAMEALAIWYELGIKKYDERNWEKGLSVKDCINRMNRHALKAANGWTDEDHLAAVMWNAAAAITMMKRKPECNDHVWHYDEIKIPVSPEAETVTLYSNDKPIATFKISDADEIHNLLREDDKFFLIKALESGGIIDLETLRDWVNRRIK